MDLYLCCGTALMGLSYGIVKILLSSVAFHPISVTLNYPSNVTHTIVAYPTSVTLFKK